MGKTMKRTFFVLVIFSLFLSMFTSIQGETLENQMEGTETETVQETVQETVITETQEELVDSNGFELESFGSINVSRFEINTLGGDSFYSGEEIVAYVGMSLSDESGSIPNSILEIRIPKKYVVRSSFDASDVNMQESKVITETEDELIIAYELKTLTAGLSLDIPLKFVTINRDTPNLTEIPYKAVLKDANTNAVIVPEIEESVTIKTYDPITTKRIRSSGSNWSALNDRTANGGKEDPNKPGYLSENLDELDFIRFSFRMQATTNSAVGNRKFERIIIEDTLPEGAVFIQSANPGWVYDPQTNIATYEYVSSNGLNLYYINFDSTVYLDLKFPGAQISTETFTNTIKTTAYQHNQGENEEPIVSQDDIIFKVTNTPEATVASWSVSKGRAAGTDLSNYDNQAGRDKTHRWHLTVNVLDESRNVVVQDYNLNTDLKFVGLTFDAAFLPSGDKTVDVDVVFTDNTTQVIASNINIESIPYIELPENVREVFVRFTGDTYLEANKSFRVYVDTELKDKENNIFPVGTSGSKTMYNYMRATLTQNDVSGTLTSSSSIRYYSTTPIVSLSKTIRNSKSTYFYREPVKFTLQVNVGRFSKDTYAIEDTKAVDIIPQGMVYIPGSATLRKFSSAVSDLTPGNFEPEVISNFKGTGQTALVWDLSSFESSLASTTTSSVAYFAIDYDLEITALTSQGGNLNTAYLSWSNIDEVVPSSHANDIYDLNENGLTNDGVARATRTFNYVPPRELIVTKSTKGSLDSNFMLPPNVGYSELDSILTYKFDVYNNSNEALSQLFLMDILPTINDLTVSEDLTLEIPSRVPRGSTFTLGLVEAIIVPSGYEVWYSNQEVGDDPKAFYVGDHWVLDVDDFSTVKAFKIELIPGNILDSGDNISFTAKFKTPKDYTLDDSDIAVNSIGFSPTSRLQFFESNFISNKIITYKVDGYIFEDFNRNGIYDQVSEKTFGNHTVILVDNEGNPVLDLEGEPYETKTNSGGYYAFDVYRNGDYKIKVLSPSGYEITEFNDDSNGSKLQNTNTTDAFKLNVENRSQRLNAGFYQEINTMEILKIVNDANGNPISKEETFTFELYIDGAPYSGEATVVDTSLNTSTDIAIENGMISLKSYERVVIRNFPSWATYKVEEMENENYTVLPVSRVYEGEINTSSVGLEFTNTVKILKTDYTVDKVWVGGSISKPNVDITLLRNGEPYLEVRLTNLSGWTHTWEDLDANDEQGNEYVYSVDELNVPKGYEKSINGNTITNTYIATTEVVVDKLWVGGPVEKPSIEIGLYMNGELVDSVVLDGSEDWTHTFDQLPIYDEQGNEYVYSIDELDVPERYEKSINGSTITNTYIATTEVVVDKLWVGGPVEKPSIEIGLYMNGELVDSVVLDGSENWTHTFDQLPIYDEQGNEYVYSIDELDVPEGYEKSINGNTIANTYIATTEVVVDKVWVGGPVEKPSIEIGLYMNGELVDSVVLDGSEDWTHTFDQLPIYDEEGVAYVYTVDELNLPQGYSKQIDGYTITNTFGIGRISVNMVKIWKNAPENKPSIQIQLYQNGEPYGDPRWLHNGENELRWDNLPSKDETGKLYTYSVKEITKLANYEMSQSGNVITNTYVEHTLPGTGSNNLNKMMGYLLITMGFSLLLIISNRKDKKTNKK